VILFVYSRWIFNVKRLAFPALFQYPQWYHLSLQQVYRPTHLPLCVTWLLYLTSHIARPVPSEPAGILPVVSVFKL
jgi:hypothetical protein